MKKTLPIILLLIMAACGRPKELPVLNLSASIGRSVPDTFTWNSIAEQITLIPIETSDEIILGSQVFLVHVSDDSYYVADRQTCSIYRIDRNGKVITSFSRRGRGPGEIISLGAAYVNQGKGIIQLFDRGSGATKRVEYDLTGRHIRTTDMSGQGLQEAMFISDDYIVFRGITPLGGGNYKFYVTDNDLNILHSLFPADSSDLWIPVDISNIYNSDMLIIDPREDETVFRITDKGAEPLFVLKMGSYRRAPDEPSPITMLMPNGDPADKLTSLYIGSIPNYYIISYNKRNQAKWYFDLWSKADNEIVSRTVSEGNTGFNLTLPSGKTIGSGLRTIYYIDGNTVAFLVQANEIFEEIEGAKKDDNPVIVHIRLKN